MNSGKILLIHSSQSLNCELLLAMEGFPLSSWLLAREWGSGILSSIKKFQLSSFTLKQNGPTISPMSWPLCVTSEITTLTADANKAKCHLKRRTNSIGTSFTGIKRKNPPVDVGKKPRREDQRDRWMCVWLQCLLMFTCRPLGLWERWPWRSQ